jgi:hypothetical protein
MSSNCSNDKLMLALRDARKNFLKQQNSASCTQSQLSETKKRKSSQVTIQNVDLNDLERNSAALPTTMFDASQYYSRSKRFSASQSDGQETETTIGGVEDKKVLARNNSRFRGPQNQSGNCRLSVHQKDETITVQGSISCCNDSRTGFYQLSNNN